MVLNFPLIQPHLQQNVLQKLDFVDFSRFSQCSCFSTAFSKCLKGRLPCEGYHAYATTYGFEMITDGHSGKSLPISICDQFPVNFHIRDVNFINKYTTETCEEIIKFIQSGKIKIHKISFISHIEGIPPETANQLLKICQVEALYFQGKFPVDYLLQEEVKKISRLEYFSSSPEESIPFDVFLDAKSDYMELHNVTFNPHSLNIFLKQWYDKLRNIEQTKLISLDLMDKEYDIFCGIPHEMIWSKDFHRNIISKRAIEEMEEFEDYCFYSLLRDNEKLFVKVSSKCFYAQLVNDPIQAFIDFVNEAVGIF